MYRFISLSSSSTLHLLLSGAFLPILLFISGCNRGTQNPASADHAVADTVYTCSMHPQVRQPNKGLCPLCAMELIPVSADQGTGDEWAVSLSSQARKLAKVQTTPVRRAFPEKELRLSGRIELDETRIRTIAARFPARVDRLFVDYVGVTVRQGDHLAEVFSTALLAAQADLISALRYDNGALIHGAREKLRLWGLSEAAIREIEQNRVASDRMQIDSPISGIVLEKEVNEGDYVETGTRMFRVAEMDRLWLILEAYEADLPWIRYGKPVTFTVESLPGREFTGTVAFIQPVVDPRMRTTRVRVNVENPQGILKPGMFARAVLRSRIAADGQVIDLDLGGKWISPMHPEIIKEHPGQCDICGMDLIPIESYSGPLASPSESEKETAGAHATEYAAEAGLVIPVSSVLRTGKRAIVYVEVPGQEQPVYEGREVVLGPKANDVYLVRSGLREGERVVTHGAFKIDSSLQIQGKKSMMDAAFWDTQDGTEASSNNLPREPYDGFYPVFDSLLQQYFVLQNALAADDLAITVETVKQMLPLLESITLQDRGTGIAALHHILHAQDLETARRGFELLSDWITHWLKAYGTTIEGNIWRMSCPMVFGNHTAYWLQNHGVLLNPYHGASMLRCGDTEEILTRTPQPTQPVTGSASQSDR